MNGITWPKTSRLLDCETYNPDNRTYPPEIITNHNELYN